MACFVIRGITKLFILFPRLIKKVSQILIWPFFLPLIWDWVLTLDLFGAFHLGFPWPCLYARTHFALKREVQLSFHVFLDHLAFDPFDMTT